MGTKPRIAVRGLSHTFENGSHSLTALSDVSLDVVGGSFVTISGPSGGGKTTLLKAVGGLLTPSKGEILVAGHSPSEAQRRRLIGFVFQDPSLLPWRTVLRNVQLPIELGAGNGGPPEEEAARLVEVVGLEEFSDYHPYELSGGMRQRVALARALAVDPDVLLMDEPLGALDEMTRSAMRYELLRVWSLSNKTVVMVTHSIPEAVMLSDRVLVLSSRPGRIVDELNIDLPRPRSEALERSQTFLDYTYRINEALSGSTSLDKAAVEAHA